MPINATLYDISGTPPAWRQRANNSANLGATLQNHAEQALLNGYNGNGTVLIVQNAYPCTGCNDFFKRASRNGRNLIIKATADQGSYGAEHGFPLNRAPVPAIFYYRNGAAKIVTMTSADRNPPAGFPDVPDFSNL